MMFQVGDCVVAKRGQNEQVGLIFKVSDVSSEANPDRCIFSVRFQTNTEIPATFVWQKPMHCGGEHHHWILPDTSNFEPYLRKIMRGGCILWEEE